MSWKRTAANLEVGFGALLTTIGYSILSEYMSLLAKATVVSSSMPDAIKDLGDLFGKESQFDDQGLGRLAAGAIVLGPIMLANGIYSLVDLSRKYSPPFKVEITKPTSDKPSE